MGQTSIFKHCVQGGCVAHQAEALRRADGLMHEMALTDLEAIPGVHLDAQQFDQAFNQPALQVDAHRG